MFRACKRFFSRSKISGSLYVPPTEIREKSSDLAFANEEILTDQSGKFKWKQVVFQDAIKARNRPKVAVKEKPEKIPFFFDLEKSVMALKNTDNLEEKSHLNHNIGLGVLEDAFEKDLWDKSTGK